MALPTDPELAPVIRGEELLRELTKWAERMRAWDHLLEEMLEELEDGQWVVRFKQSIQQNDAYREAALRELQRHHICNFI